MPDTCAHNEKKPLDHCELVFSKEGYFNGTRSVEIHLGVPNKNVSVRLMKSASISGVVSIPDNSSGLKVTDVRLLLLSPFHLGFDPRWQESAKHITPRVDGSFKFDGLRPGIYTVFASIPDEPIQRCEETFCQIGPSFIGGAATLEDAQRVTLHNGSTVITNLDLGMRTLFPVVIPFTAPQKQVKVAFLGNQAFSGPDWAMSNDGKSIETLLPQGRYSILLTSIQGEKTLFAETEVGVNSKVGTLAPVSFIPGGKIRFTVNCERENPVSKDVCANVEVEVRPATEGLPHPESAASTKRSFTIDKIAPGAYNLRLRADNYVASATVGLRDVIHNPVLVGQGETNVDLIVRDDWVTIEGTVANMPAGMVQGGFAPSVHVEARPMDGERTLYSRDALVSQDGHFSFRLSPGVYRVFASVIGTGDYSGEIPYDQSSLEMLPVSIPTVDATRGCVNNLSVPLLSSEDLVDYERR